MTDYPALRDVMAGQSRPGAGACDVPNIPCTRSRDAVYVSSSPVIDYSPEEIDYIENPVGHAQAM
jgi:hypothetical protein